MPKSDAAADHERNRRESKARKNGQVNDPRTITAAGFLIYLTSLSPDEASAQELVRLNRMRWQIELAFKHMKSLGGFDAVRASDPRLVKTWLLAHLIAAIFTVPGRRLSRQVRRIIRQRRDEPSRRRASLAHAAQSALS